MCKHILPSTQENPQHTQSQMCKCSSTQFRGFLYHLLFLNYLKKSYKQCMQVRYMYRTSINVYVLASNFVLCRSDLLTNVYKTIYGVNNCISHYIHTVLLNHKFRTKVYSYDTFFDKCILATMMRTRFTINNRQVRSFMT